jgi:hypothetical protein
MLGFLCVSNRGDKAESNHPIRKLKKRVYTRRRVTGFPQDYRRGTVLAHWYHRVGEEQMAKAASFGVQVALGQGRSLLCQGRTVVFTGSLTRINSKGRATYAFSVTRQGSLTAPVRSKLATRLQLNTNLLDHPTPTRQCSASQKTQWYTSSECMS